MSHQANQLRTRVSDAFYGRDAMWSAEHPDTFSKNKGVIPTSCLRMLMDVGVDLDFIELFGLLLKLSYVTFAIAFLMSLLVVLFCWQLCQLLIISLNPT